MKVVCDITNEINKNRSPGKRYLNLNFNLKLFHHFASYIAISLFEFKIVFFLHFTKWKRVFVSWYQLMKQIKRNFKWKMRILENMRFWVPTS